MIEYDNVYRFLNKSEIIDIIKKIDNVIDSDVRARLYLVTLSYRSIDITNLTIIDGEELSKNIGLPKEIRQTFSNAVNRRKDRIKKFGLVDDIEYLFVNENDIHIHDCILLRDWRRFLNDNNIDDINIQVFRLSMNYLKLFKQIEKRRTNKKEMEDYKNEFE